MDECPLCFLPYKHKGKTCNEALVDYFERNMDRVIVGPKEPKRPSLVGRL